LATSHEGKDTESLKALLNAPVYLSGLPQDAYERERDRYWSMVAPTEGGQLSALKVTMAAAGRAMKALDEHIVRDARVDGYRPVGEGQRIARRGGGVMLADIWERPSWRSSRRCIARKPSV
jgi:hypothetical protein